jgi:phosphoribosylglycinamide formyltransferase, formyltetrahydrofolate-dependent
MVKLNGKKINTAIFISGRGSNLKSLINFFKKKNSPILIKLIVSNNPKAKGLIYAEQSKINKYIINFKNKKISEKNLLKKLLSYNINLICLAGFMKILSGDFIKNFTKPILNIHPSLLPKYKGLNTHKRVIKNKEKYSGSTVHLVTSKLDCGKIILQKKIRISKNENEKSLEKKVLKIEHKLYPKAIEKFLDSNL